MSLSSKFNFLADLLNVQEYIKENPLTFVVSEKRTDDSFEISSGVFLAPLSNVYKRVVNNDNTDGISFIVYDKKNGFNELSVYSEYKKGNLNPLDAISTFEKILDRVGIDSSDFAHIPDKKKWPIENNNPLPQKTEE